MVDEGRAAAPGTAMAEIAAIEARRAVMDRRDGGAGARDANERDAGADDTNKRDTNEHDAGAEALPSGPGSDGRAGPALGTALTGAGSAGGQAADADSRDDADAHDDNGMSEGSAREAARLEASHELSHAWARAVVDITFEVLGTKLRIDTEHVIDLDRAGPMHTVHGRIGRSAFAFELPQALFAAIAAQLPDPVDLDKLSEADAALLIEHMLTGPLERIEGEIGETISIDEVERGPIFTELEPIIAAVWIGDKRHSLRAVFGDPLHMRILTEWLRPFVMADEFDAGTQTRVEIGPIVLDAADLGQLEPGDALAIGTEPGKNLIGRLVRATGRMVPIAIDTAQVIVSGTAREPGDPLLPPLGADEVALGVGIGTVRMTPTHLKRATSGNRFIMERNPNNRCALYLGDEAVAQGELTLIDGQLAVEVRMLSQGTLPPHVVAAIERREARDWADMDAAGGANGVDASSGAGMDDRWDEDWAALEDASEGGAFDDPEEIAAIDRAALPTAPRDASAYGGAPDGAAMPGADGMPETGAMPGGGAGARGRR